MVDTFAAEYGWTKDYTLYEVYPAEAFSLFPKIAKRQLNAFVDQIEIQVITKHDLKPEDREKWLRSVDRMRDQAQEAPPDKPLDRAKLEQLREVMGKRKGRTPQRS